MNDLLNIVNTVRENKSVAPLAELRPDMRLREELGFDSLDLAELTVRIEAKYRVDVFAAGVVNSVAEVAGRLEEHTASSAD